MFELSIFKSSGKKAVEQLIKHIDFLSQKSGDTQKDLMRKFLADAKEHNDYGEWGLAMENLLQNLYEIDFKIDTITVELAKEAFKKCQMDYTEYIFIEELVQ
ncbi:MAG: hypothetical protein K1X55_13010 [Chitinophagales bacterium]|nr:hypothetical protein [Chitinophagales bacterium]